MTITIKMTVIITATVTIKITIKITMMTMIMLLVIVSIISATVITIDNKNGNENYHVLNQYTAATVTTIEFNYKAFTKAITRNYKVDVSE